MMMYGIVLYGIVLYGKVLYGMIWCCMLRCCMVCYDAIYKLSVALNNVFLAIDCFTAVYNSAVQII